MDSDARTKLEACVVREWITGEFQECRRIFFLDPGASIHDLEKVFSSGDAVLLPSEFDVNYEAVKTISFGGQMLEAGDEFFFGKQCVELQDYLSAAFVEIVTSTVVRFFDEDGWQAFLDDADLARYTGVFPSSLLDRHVLLADREALSKPFELNVPRSIRLSADGTISLGLQGKELGRLQDLQTLLETPVPNIAMLSGEVATRSIEAGLASRSWIERYFNAIDLMKMLRLENGRSKISGFGWSYVEDGQSDSDPLASDPFLFESSKGLMLADITSLRRQLLTPHAASVVAIVQTSSSSELATERVAEYLNVSTEKAAAMCFEASQELNVHLGNLNNVAHVSLIVGER